jgi:lantibiotic modifying enzyme
MPNTLPDKYDTRNGEYDRTYSVNFCAGQAGVIPMLIEAAQLFPMVRERCLLQAINMARITYKEGLTHIGNSLSHGISGNAFLINSLSRCFHKLA